MTDEAWYIVRNTPGVTGFIGSSGGGAKPFPVSPEEIDLILRRIGMSDRKVSVNFTTGDRVKILTGPFSGIEGSIDAMNDDTQTATVLCILFGRETPTEIAYNDLEKVERVNIERSSPEFRAVFLLPVPLSSISSRRGAEAGNSLFPVFIMPAKRVNA